MSTWLMDTPLFKILATPKAKPLLEWCKANEPSLFISAASLTEITLGIKQATGPQSHRASAQRDWLEEIIMSVPDRIHPVVVGQLLKLFGPEQRRVQRMAGEALERYPSRCSALRARPMRLHRR
jgi:hypothetical protein